jgi:hypothetical protein
MSELLFTNASAYSLTTKGYKTLWLAALGGVLQFYDFVIFVFFTNTIAHLFFPPSIPDWLRQFQTLAIFGTGYLARFSRVCYGSGCGGSLCNGFGLSGAGQIFRYLVCLTT